MSRLGQYCGRVRAIRSYPQPATCCQGLLTWTILDRPSHLKTTDRFVPDEEGSIFIGVPLALAAECLEPIWRMNIDDHGTSIYTPQ